MSAATFATAPGRRSLIQNQRPRLGFVGTGWIGLSRMEVLARSGLVEVGAIVEPVPEMARKAAEAAPDAIPFERLEDILDLNLDGVVIATPSALHAAQAITALEHGLAVFCQKPLARNGEETQQVVDAAMQVDRLLGVDFSYRFLDETQAIRHLIQTGELGEIYAAELTFHNAYGPDKAWFYEKEKSGGGCVMDLGIHLVDLAEWMLDYPKVVKVSSRLYAQGEPMQGKDGRVEDFATARLDLANGASVQLACSWKLHAGCDAVISGNFFGTKGGAGFRNLDGSFYKFTAERFGGTKREMLAMTTEEWGGRAAVEWGRQLQRANRFAPEITTAAEVARILDEIYAA